VCGRVAEPSRDIAQGHVVPIGDRVVGDPQRAVSPDDHHRPIRVQPLVEKGSELVAVAGGRDMQVGIERAARERDRRSDALGVRRPGPLVDEDRGRCVFQGRPLMISAATF
jgi:hypothetical protein